MNWYMLQIGTHQFMFYAEAQMMMLVGLAANTLRMSPGAIPGWSGSGNITLYQYGSGTWQPINTF